jgi:xanthine/uracil permease
MPQYKFSTSPPVCPFQILTFLVTHLMLIVSSIIYHRWGSPEFIGLGFLSFISISLTEIFGSPFLKNISIIVGLVVGCIVAGAAGYIDGSSIKSAPAITFLW